MIKLRINVVYLNCCSKTTIAGWLSCNRLSAFVLHMAGRFTTKESGPLVSSEHSVCVFFFVFLCLCVYVSFRLSASRSHSLLFHPPLSTGCLITHTYHSSFGFLTTQSSYHGPISHMITDFLTVNVSRNPSSSLRRPQAPSILNPAATHRSKCDVETNPGSRGGKDSTFPCRLKQMRDTMLTIQKKVTTPSAGGPELAIVLTERTSDNESNGRGIP